MPYNKVINQEIQYPIEYHVSTSARRITEQLLRHNIAERLVEEIYNLCNYLREFIHFGHKITAFFRHVQIYSVFL